MVIFFKHSPNYLCSLWLECFRQVPLHGCYPRSQTWSLFAHPILASSYWIKEVKTRRLNTIVSNGGMFVGGDYIFTVANFCGVTIRILCIVGATISPPSSSRKGFKFVSPLLRLLSSDSTESPKADAHIPDQMTKPQSGPNCGIRSRDVN
ncbi:hypothetical protein TcWFU_001981 [Taenia crassiceps]|uniref:Uncharacterized protein n=1 Tax=Taenia crassiceps TaxID=6207 RepID=A0ABR4Q0N8_9CEST